jgi:hypothetical protein
VCALLVSGCCHTVRAVGVGHVWRRQCKRWLCDSSKVVEVVVVVYVTEGLRARQRQPQQEKGSVVPLNLVDAISMSSAKHV